MIRYPDQNDGEMTEVVSKETITKTYKVVKVPLNLGPGIS